ncbi:MAG: cobalamin B12-binding domain-containing protein [Archaeoglobi archaeon]|nr:cobalamin B12-binding domain-containing protein [Candidatus Mnemosynella sp.]
MAEVLLINPPESTNKYRTFLNVLAPPLGIAYIGAVLEESGISVRIIDAPALRMGIDEVVREIKSESPKLIGITCTTPMMPHVSKLIKKIKEEGIDSPIVCGGNHPTFCDEDTLRSGADFVVRGEGEITFLELYRTLENGGELERVKGISFLKDGGLFRTAEREKIEDLDSLPFPARHLLPMDRYQALGLPHRFTTMIASRGCPMGCSFCASSAFHGRKLRIRSVENVVDEIEHVIEEYGIEFITFMDDTFTLLKNWVERFCDEILRRKIEIKWGATARVDRMSLELLRKMKESGCVALFIGVESGDQEILDRITKNVVLDQTKRAFENMRRAGILSIASVAIGYPGETRRSIERTMKFIEEIKPDYFVASIATPYPGTRFYEEMKESGLIVSDRWEDYTLFKSTIKCGELEPEELEKLRYEMMKRFYLRPAKILKMLRRDGWKSLSVIKHLALAKLVS